jgi:hypothetical protein
MNSAAARISGTEISDHVEYSALGGSLLDRLLVARKVRAIFDFPREKLIWLFPRQQVGMSVGVSGERIKPARC